MIKIIFIISFIFLLTNVHADIISINSAGSSGEVLTPESYIEGFFFSSENVTFNNITYPDEVPTGTGSGGGSSSNSKMIYPLDSNVVCELNNLYNKSTLEKKLLNMSYDTSNLDEVLLTCSKPKRTYNSLLIFMVILTVLIAIAYYNRGVVMYLLGEKRDKNPSKKDS